MGYYLIFPSTEVAQSFDGMKARGQHDIKLIALTVNMVLRDLLWCGSRRRTVFNATSEMVSIYA